ncbi:MAG: hypothetical protein ACLP8S_00765 [Solirubrobacteraceae bacterium]
MRRLATPTAATILGLVALASAIGVGVLQLIEPDAGSPFGAANVVSVVTGFVFALSFIAVGLVVARRDPSNPMGWLLLGVSLAIQLGSCAPAYAYLDYHSHHGALPFGHVAVLLSGLWICGFMLLPLIVLLFPDGNPGPRWRWPLRLYVAIWAILIAGMVRVAVSDLSLRMPVDGGGNLHGLNNPAGWFGAVFKVGLLSCLLLAVVAIVRQALAYRRARGERRQQLKWLGAGATSCVFFLLVSVLWKNAPGIVGEFLVPVGLTALPLAMGVGILKYRLYEIDRLISRTLSYAILTALLGGTLVGLVALTTDLLPFSSSVGVAASTLAAAALFNPLRGRVQRVVDRRFNRRRYDAEATVAAFAARLRDAVDLDAIQAELLQVVQQAVEPSQATVWMRRRSG